MFLFEDIEILFFEKNNNHIFSRKKTMKKYLEVVKYSKIYYIFKFNELENH